MPRDSFYLILNMQNKCSKAIDKALDKFIQEYEPATRQEAIYFLSSLALQYHIKDESGDKSFTVTDAYDFMLKAGFCPDDKTKSPDRVEWLMKRRKK